MGPRSSWLAACVLCACADASLQPSAAQLALAEEATWQPAPLIPAFESPVLATFGERVVLIGETTQRDWLNSFDVQALDMWEWDGSAWAPRASAHRPSSRLLPGLARLRDKLVMFGGFHAGQQDGREVGLYSGETWEWDGSDWTQIYPLRSPYGRAQVPFVPWQDKVLMFGGQTGGGVASDTWTWDARDWIQQRTTQVPEYCSSQGAAIGGRAILFCSARDAADHLGHTWEWDGRDWHEKTPNTRPSNRYAHTLASFGDRVVMYGGYADSGNTQETWVWDGEDWTDVSVTPSPPARTGYQAAQLGAELVLYGGGTNETWAWNGTSWRIVAPRPMPPARADYALTTVGKHVILFGGCCKSANEYWDDTWQWDGSRWSQLTAATSPPGRAGSGLTSLGDDSALLFGGIGARGVLDDTWQWDALNTTWIERTSATRPPARQLPALASLGSTAIMFGGASSRALISATALGDTWAWDDALGTWQPLVTSEPPPPGYGLALGRLGTQLILVATDASWAWNGTTWSQLPAPIDWWGVSPPLYAATLATPEGERLIVAAASWDNLVYGSAWDGNAWSTFPMPGDYTLSAFPAQSRLARPFTHLESSLVMLSGALERTWIYASR